MNYNLFGYDLNGQTVGVDISRFYLKDLDGNEPFVLASGQTLTGYTNITSIENMYNFGSNPCGTYQTWQKGVRLCGYEVGWSAMTDTQKDYIIDVYAYPEGLTEIITYLVTTKGMTQNEAENYLTDIV